MKPKSALQTPKSLSLGRQIKRMLSRNGPGIRDMALLPEVRHRLSACDLNEVTGTNRPVMLRWRPEDPVQDWY